MKGMEYNYLLQDKTIEKKQEIDLLRQKATVNKQDEELRIKSEDHHSKNERDLKELERKISVNMPKDKGEIEATMARINFESTHENDEHEDKMDLNKTYLKDIAKIELEKEKFMKNQEMNLEEIGIKVKLIW